MGNVSRQAHRSVSEGGLHKGKTPPIDVIIKFKASVLRKIYNLSFNQAEYQINDRLSFMRFLGLGLGNKVLDSHTLWNFENTLSEAEVMEELNYSVCSIPCWNQRD